MTFSPATPPYDYEHIPTNIPIHHRTTIDPPSSPPDLHKELVYSHHRTKPLPYKSPSMKDTSGDIVFQLRNSKSRVLRGQSLFSLIRKNIIKKTTTKKKVTHWATLIEIPKLSLSMPVQEEELIDYYTFKKPVLQQQQAYPSIHYYPTTPSSSSSSSGRPCRIKGPCQACQETADGCMRKAFDWPFETNQTFYDKGKPYVYLCNKCGLRYNKSGGLVCRHCRWVFCKEEKRKALNHIEEMRRRRPDGFVDPDEDIENFVCTPKYWSCGKPWKVGWVLNNNEDEEDQD
ncbi:hypothetical protein G6F62_003912 [Rhizopus arrhizus]|nr:hypothetical protein G6F24_005076 [Rhizopus arrhizus]KAG0773996.1 hypothetical protein G6F22_014418 [Rhizopus arrhizus]KAG0793338.1 hypothetical protein G6F21_003697 [Rhizopus arrhizus]KAG0814047.1 hypothetical protein G6F20_005079 [Rhizopus arrhizus]KAG0839600.1 hypothetical protein G6F19_002484 [Rhizopus arrhizus]